MATGHNSIASRPSKRAMSLWRPRQLLWPQTVAPRAAALLLYLVATLLLGVLAAGVGRIVSAGKGVRGRALTATTSETGAVLDEAVMPGRRDSEPSLETLTATHGGKTLAPPSNQSSADKETTRNVLGSSADKETRRDTDALSSLSWTVDEVVAHVAGPNRSLIAVPVTSNYLDFSENFFLSASRLGLGDRVLFVTMDDESWEQLQASRPHQTVRVQSLGATEPLTGNKSDAVFNSVFFHSVVDRKPKYIRALLEKDVSVLFSDADVVLLGDPYRFLTGKYDVWLTKDTMTFRDVHRPVPLDFPRALRRKEISPDGRFMCSCFVYVRPTPGGKLLMDSWHKAIKEHWEETGKGIGDQKMLNKVLVATPQSLVRVAVLPTTRFPSGCLYFGAEMKPCPIEHWLFQKAVLSGRAKPIWAHNNWVEGHDVKLGRFVEQKLWFVGSPGAGSGSSENATQNVGTYLR